MKVSIIIPVYKAANYIELCIKSIMNQTYQDIECFLVNDVSPDDSVAIAERLIANYNGPIQFHILNHEQNSGPAVARNTGISAATGDYICFMDSDDEITPDCIEKLAQPILKDPTIEMVEGCYTIITTNESGISSEHPVSKPHFEFTNKKAVREFYFSRRYENILPWNKLVSKKFLLKNNLYFRNIRVGEDNLWHFHYFQHLSHLYIIPDITYKYYTRPNSITTTPHKDSRNRYAPLYAEIAKSFSPVDGVLEAKQFLKGFCLFYLGGPETPIYKQTASEFLKIFKKHHYIKEYLFLKSVVILSKWEFARKLIKNTGVFLKRKTTKN